MTNEQIQEIRSMRGFPYYYYECTEYLVEQEYRAYSLISVWACYFLLLSI